MKKTVVLGVTSGIAAFKTLELIELLRREDIDVFVIMTKSAMKMVTVHEFETASGNKVYTELFEKGFEYKEILKDRRVDHIQLADKADVMVIVPATANCMAKIAHGMADDFLTTTLLAVTAPVIICPAMNVNMWNNPAVKRNLEALMLDGYQIVKPVAGMLACGYEGIGRLEDIQRIKDEIVRQLHRTSKLKGKKIIVTAGGSMEKIDDIRYITNRSSGKMGAAIADECFLQGAEVLFLRAKNAVKPHYLIKEEIFNTSEDLFRLIQKCIKDYDVLFHTAAISDFQVAEPLEGKISSDKAITVQLKPTIKILDQLKKLNPTITVVAFKAEYGLEEQALIQKAKQRLKESHADFIIANDVSKTDRGFEADTNEVFIISRNGTAKKIPLSSKRDVAKQIIDEISTHYNCTKEKFVNSLPED